MQTYGHTGPLVGRAKACAMARSIYERKLPLLDELLQNWSEQAAAKRGMKVSGCNDAARRGTLQRSPLDDCGKASAKAISQANRADHSEIWNCKVRARRPSLPYEPPALALPRASKGHI